jgi:hypothetical protein
MPFSFPFLPLTLSIYLYPSHSIPTILHLTQVRGVDPDKDIAVLKLIEDGDKKSWTKESIRPIQLGSSKSLRVGQLAVAIGESVRVRVRVRVKSLRMRQLAVAIGESVRVIG